MSESKKRFNERVSLMCAHKRKDNKQVFPMVMMTEKKAIARHKKNGQKKEK
jgi:hypothetical protein